ncbi:MAG TPA: hypothetical protein VE643_04930 [Nitrososphaeraceae archaeon]|nr:hypothetical protein [Nitrososphaeraceae archaeon]
MKDAIGNSFTKEEKDAVTKDKDALPKNKDDAYYNKIHHLYRSKAGDFQNIFVALLIASIFILRVG